MPSLEKAVGQLLSLQREDGSWEGEMVWNTMLSSQVVMVRHMVGRPVEPGNCDGMVRYFRTWQLTDGSWGMHPESSGYLFLTVMAYVALRLLGRPADDPMLQRARAWLSACPEGVVAVPTWGKFWLALLGLYEYEGMNPIPPELFVLPAWLPFHPRRFYCHTRIIYRAMAWLYGRRFKADLGPLGEALRAELYGVPYESIDFSSHRHALSGRDVFVRPSALLRLAWDLLSLYERRPVSSLRRQALDVCLDDIVYEQRASRYHGLSPVSGLLNCLALRAADPHHPDLEDSLRGVEAWRWQDEVEGIRYVGARSNTWDTAHAVQALAAHPGPGVERATRYLCSVQVSCELNDRVRHDRDPVLGGWCFSDGQHRWPVSDCTAEAVCALLVAGVHDPFRLALAARFILQRQNPDGSFGTYEARRGSTHLEAINPSEMFSHCMTEGSYLECTASCLEALGACLRHCPSVLPPGTGPAMVRAVLFLRTCQRSDGSFAGVWGICFTYGAFHAVRGLLAAGLPPEDPALQRVAAWLTSTQRPDGGWGEHYTSCLLGRYVEHPHSQVEMTSWALLALLEVVGAQHDAVRRGIAWLEGQQADDGSWPQGAVNGVFFGTAMLNYRLYRIIFPTRALARFAALQHA